MTKKIDTILSEALVEKGLMENNQLEAFIKEAEVSGEGLQQILLKHHLFPEKDILNVLAQKLGVAYVDLGHRDIERKVLEKVPMKIASYYRFIPLTITGRILTVAVAAPLETKIQDEIRIQLGYNIEIALASQNDISDALKKYYELSAETVDKIVSSTSEERPSSAPEMRQPAVEDIEKMAGDATVISLVNQILLEGWRKRATDVHIEPQRQGVSLRYRIDGLLYDAQPPPEISNLLNAIISRIKIMSNLNIVERRLPQDGRAIVNVQEETLDLRISTIPTPFGESLVIRILPMQMLFSLEKLGLVKKDLQIFEQLVLKPHGIIFVAGPTGSGKTTTLYACLNRINTRERKIITLEDPIEYEMAGITQIQVMPEIKFDFARGLRSILRHDPDVIMVGEVRDLETAETAIRVALTGHLVFSTLHTNDAASGIARLQDIGVEPYLLASSVEAFIAQRLLRTICPDCRYEDKNISNELKVQIARDLDLNSTESIKIYRGKGCENCNKTGFFGRVAIYEILLVDEELKASIIKKIPSSELKKMAIAKGMRTLRQDGWQKVIAGITTPEEVVRTTSMEKEESFFGKDAFASSVQESSTNEHTTASALERRVYPRLDSKVNVRFKVFKSKEELIKRGFNPDHLSVTKNISAGGIVFVSHEPLAVGSLIELGMEIPGMDEPIECLARVLRVQEIKEEEIYDVVVYFLDIASAQKTKLNKFIVT
jgi:type II secretory ATPase GspE/PulE/Tfp pilus assembly ATPase PilB-like protein